MGVTTCKDCGGKVATSLTHCPHCGAPSAGSEHAVPGVPAGSPIQSRDCPKCGAPVTVPENVDRFTCGYCDTSLAVQRDAATQAVSLSIRVGPEDTKAVALAEAAEESGNWGEAFRYWTHILEGDPSNSRAWIGKGMAAGRQSTLANNRLPETSAAFEKALTMGQPTLDEFRSIVVDGSILGNDFEVVAGKHHRKFYRTTDTSGMSASASMDFKERDRQNNWTLHKEYASHLRSVLNLFLVCSKAAERMFNECQGDDELSSSTRKLTVGSLELQLKLLRGCTESLNSYRTQAGMGQFLRLDANPELNRKLIEDVATVMAHVVQLLPEDSATKKAIAAEEASRKAKAEADAQKAAARAAANSAWKAESRRQYLLPAVTGLGAAAFAFGVGAERAPVGPLMLIVGAYFAYAEFWKHQYSNQGVANSPSQPKTLSPDSTRKVVLWAVLAVVIGTGIGFALSKISGTGSIEEPSLAVTDSAAAPMESPPEFIPDNQMAVEEELPDAVEQPITGTMHTVNMVGDGEGYRFEPAEITVSAGDVVKFVMVNGGPHNVAFDPAMLSAEAKAALSANMPQQGGELSGAMLLNSSEEYSVSFANVPAGTYDYFCTPHLQMNMKGKIIVR